ncbi:MAG: glycosyltransferase family 2 protein [Clostridia bacterium]|nr:glycosyltransferase family 2 protein [Clostridia bacterium]
MTKSVIVSVVMPVYNEERYIKKCVESLLLQDYPIENMEWIFVDGCSKDSTVELLDDYREKYPHLIKILSNPKKIVPVAMNIGIAESVGKYIVRLDAHADYAVDYISKCVYYLENTDAENVGGVAETKSCGFMGCAIAKMLSSKFGVGNSQFRTNGNSGYVDTVPFGAFRREVFSKYGGYDERLVRNQDNEMNFRIRKNGGKIYLSNDIRLSYYCRDSVKGISDMARKNGMWNIITMKLCPGSMGLRHFIPFLFVFSIVGLAIMGFLYPVFWVLLGAELALYLFLDVVFSARLAKSVGEFFALMALFPMFHTTYGFGSVIGITKLFSKQFNKGAYENKKI